MARSLVGHLACLAAFVWTTSLAPLTAWAGGAVVRGWVLGLASADSAIVVLDGPQRQRVSTRPGGQWQSGPLLPGTYRVSAEHPAYGFQPTQHVVKLGKATVQAVNFRAFRLDAPEPATRTVSIARGRIRGLSRRDRVELHAEGLRPATVAVAAGGRFEFRPEEPGLYRLTPAGDGLVFTPEALELRLEGEDAAGVEFVARRGRRLPDSGPEDTSAVGPFQLVGGVIGLGKGQTARVSAVGADNRIESTDARGRFVFRHLPFGRFTLRVDLPECPGCRWQLTPENMDVVLDRDTGGLFFRVRAASH